MAYVDQCDGCNKLVKLEERIKHINISQEKLDRMLENLITLNVKFEENEKRSEKNSRILWGVLTAVVAQAVAFLFTIMRG